MTIPDRLPEKIALFRDHSTVVQDRFGVFTTSFWMQVFLEQGIVPRDHHPLADGPSPADLRQQFDQIFTVKQRALTDMPLHDAFLAAAMQRRPS